VDRSHRTRKLTKRTFRRRPRRRSSPFESVARAESFTIRHGRTHTWMPGFSVGEWLRQWQERGRRSQGRRSKTRLAQAQPSARARRSVAPASSRPVVRLRLNGRLLLNVLVLGLLGWLGVWFFAAQQFYIDRIVVSGNLRVSPEAIVEASGLHGYSIFWVNARQVAANIVEALPPIQEVKVRCSLPDHVTLVVQEQGEQVIWQVGGDRYWVDEEGNLHPVHGEAESMLVVQDIRPGPPSQVELEAVSAARQIAHLLPELKVVEYAPITGLRFTHSRGWMVYLGVGDDMARKVSVLRAMEVQFANKDGVAPILVDLRFPERPYCRFPQDDGAGE
jgi:cell division septal protein FtsQ